MILTELLLPITLIYLMWSLFTIMRFKINFLSKLSQLLVDFSFLGGFGFVSSSWLLLSGFLSEKLFLLTYFWLQKSY